MIRHIKTIKEVPYKGHLLRKVEDEFGNVYVLVDNDSDEIESASFAKEISEFTYPSFADAKRNIDGKPMKWASEDSLFRDEYFTRFLNK